jgi:hypothetical protein
MPKVVLSTNNNLDYYFYLPITSFVWNYFGFEPISFIVGESEKDSIVVEYLKQTPSKIIRIKENPPYRSETISQFIRMYASCCLEDDNEYLIMGDVDMIPLSSYLYRDFDKRNCFGYDLTGFSEVPICYVGMYAKKWREFLNLEYGKLEENLFRDLDTIKYKALGETFGEYWNTDQDFLTKKIKEYGEHNFQFINRGLENGLAYKRIDRAKWEWKKNETYIDSHLLRPSFDEQNFIKTYELISNTLKDVDCSWMIDYFKKFNNYV